MAAKLPWVLLMEPPRVGQGRLLCRLAAVLPTGVHTTQELPSSSSLSLCWHKGLSGQLISTTFLDMTFFDTPSNCMPTDLPGA